MQKIYVFSLILLFFSFNLYSQRLEEFSENTGEFISQLEAYMTSSKRKILEDTYKEFEKYYKSGSFSSEEVKQIQKTANSMLKHRMTASPYFSEYLNCLTVVKKEDTEDYNSFSKWHTVLDSILTNIQNRKVQPYKNYLGFSYHFFEKKALRYSKTGTSWIAQTDEYVLKYESGEPIVLFDELDLMATRKEDNIQIKGTTGIYYPVSQTWKGSGGKVTWERFGLDEDVYAELPDYEIDVKKSLYEIENVRMHYPVFFGGRKIEGSFSDKLVVSNQATEGSYPRFESYENIIRLTNIGSGIEYTGGFRLQGTTIYGFGSENNPAKIQAWNEKEQLIYRGESELFTIRREERIVGERVESVLYFGQDSIYHPSVNLRLDIPKKEIELSRGARGSDRNPFFNSLHQINIDSDKINAYFDRDSVIIGEKSINIVKKKDVNFESLKFFKKSDYLRIQNIATSNPIAIMKVTAEREGSNMIDANLLAHRINSKYSVENIQSLLYDLVAKGFINYYSERQLVEVKDKVFHYANADQGKVDFDILRIVSETDDANAVLDLKNSSMRTFGVQNVEFSSSQKVALNPLNNMVVLKENRNMDFNGRLYAGFSTLEGNDFHFEYDNFHIITDSVRYFDLFVPTGDLDKEMNPVAESLSSRIEHLNGVLLIDAPLNKSGKDNIDIFPSLQSKQNSFVFYDYPSTQGGVYPRDSFYFELEPFSFNHLDRFNADDLKFKGSLYSSDIFPAIQETLVLQEADYSLGFTTLTPDEGYPLYIGKGNYSGNVGLSNKGLLGQGTLFYLGAMIDSEDIIFKPKQLLASAERFDLNEERGGEVEVPQVRGYDVIIDWRPYNDSMYIQSKEAPFDLYKEAAHYLKGTLILTPGGLKAKGLLDWDKASMTSNLFSLGAFSAQADTLNIQIKALNTEELALKTDNLNGIADFDEQIGKFKANDEFLVTTLPYNKYQTSMNEFDWDMKEETITFRADKDKLGTFTSIHPDQDSLRFKGETAFYDLKTNELEIGGVPYIVTADAFVYPAEGNVEILPGGIMTELKDAKIVADTLGKYHVINKATVDVNGKKDYKASGYYEYNIGSRQQEILFDNIIGQRVGKGKRSEKRVATRATGEVTPDDNLYIDHKTEFRGTISLESESRNLQFDGFARLDAENLPQRHWFTVSSTGDKKDLSIGFDVPKNYDGVPLRTGLFLSKETARVYPRVMMPLYFRKDRPILPVQGVFKYNQKNDEFIFGDSSKVIKGGLRGNQLTFNNRKGIIEAEGKFNIGSGLEMIKVSAAGKATTAFPMISDSLSGPTPDTRTFAEFMAAVDIIIPDRLMRMIITDIKSSGFDAKNVNLINDIEFYKKATAEIFPDNREMTESIESINMGLLSIPKKYNEHTFLFNHLPMQWDPDYQSFVSTEEKLGIVTINGEEINKILSCYVEFKMPTNEDDRLYIYLKSPSDYYYFFGFKQGILSLVSNNTKFNDEVINLKKNEKLVKIGDDQTYEIQAVNPGTAEMFVRRVRAVGKNN
ncbi:MAG: hypothetical protein GY705_29345 [Bacteroidetes bacterium]|nr:hypothetical protein [Bacteroidota bacterium]